FLGAVCEGGPGPDTVAGVTLPRGTVTPQRGLTVRPCFLGSCAGPWSHSATVPPCHVFSTGRPTRGPGAPHTQPGRHSPRPSPQEGFATQMPRPPERCCASSQGVASPARGTRLPRQGSAGGTGLQRCTRCTHPSRPALHRIACIACIACIALQQCNDATTR